MANKKKAAAKGPAMEMRGIRFPDDEWEAITRLAAADNRTASSFIRNEISKVLREAGATKRR